MRRDSQPNAAKIHPSIRVLSVIRGYTFFFFFALPFVGIVV